MADDARGPWSAEGASLAQQLSGDAPPLQHLFFVLCAQALLLE